MSAVALMSPKLRAIPYMRLREGCHVVKESIPVSVSTRLNVAAMAKHETISVELGNYFSRKELNRFSNLLYKASAFKQKLESHEIGEQFFNSNDRLLLCLRRLNLLKFDNLPAVHAVPLPGSQGWNEDLMIAAPRPVPGREVPRLPRLSGDARAVFVHPIIARSPSLKMVPREQVGTLTRENQRLEFYGDSVLGEVVARLVMERFPNATDGLLTGIKSLLVRNDTLVVYAHVVQLPLLLREFTSDDSYKHKVLADCFESYIGQSKAEGGETLQAMVTCLEQLMEPIFVRIEANLKCHLGSSELKVNEVLSDWFGFDEDARAALKRVTLKRYDSDEERQLPRFEKIANSREIEEMKFFAKSAPRFSLPDPRNRHLYPDKLLEAIKRFDAMSASIQRRREKEMRKQIHRASRLSVNIKRGSHLRLVLPPGLGPAFADIQVKRRKNHVVSRVWVSNSLVSEAKSASAKASKKKALKKFWSVYKPLLREMQHAQIQSTL